MIVEDFYPKGTWSEVVEIPPAGGLLSRGRNKVSAVPPNPSLIDGRPPHLDPKWQSRICLDFLQYDI